MNPKKRLLKPFAFIILFVAVFLIFSTLSDTIFPLLLDDNGVVTFVKDGITVQLKDGRSLKLADLDLPELNHENYGKAKDYLMETILGKKVFFDIDAVHLYDNEGEGENLACIVYSEFNLTHLINVNKFLIDSDYAIEHNYYNEFCHCSWRAFLRRTTLLELVSRYSLLISLSALISFGLFEVIDRVS